MIRLTLPYPPSANRLWRAVNGRNIKSAEYRLWEAFGAATIMKQRAGLGIKTLAGPYAITITADRPDKRRRDLGNLEKPTSDLLGLAAVIADDCNAQRIVLEWSDKPPAKPAFVHVEIEPL